MIDMHSHILPGIDDGARDTDISLELLRRLREDGVDTVCLTPHFNFERQSIEEFLDARNAARQRLEAALKPTGWALRLLSGAEVAFSPELASQDGVDRLCLEGTRCMLIELPVAYLPKWTGEVLDELQLQGIVPLLAHVERYSYFQQQPEKLYELVCDGCFAQFNATSLVKHKSLQKQILLLLRHNLLHCMGSDTHSPDKRPPILGQAAALVEKRMGADCLAGLEKNGMDLAMGRPVKAAAPKPFHKVFGKVF